MKITAADLQRHYASLSDHELRALNRDEPTELARTCYDAELQRRGLVHTAPVPSEVATIAEPAPPSKSWDGVIAHQFVETNGIRMHYAEAGAGPLVLLCHGFPESWHSWRHQLPALAAAGYRVVAPDLRGF